MTKTEDINLALEQVKLKNMSVWEYLMQICGLISSPLLPVVQRELMVYIKQSQARNRDFTLRTQEDEGLEDIALRADVIASLIAEAKVNRRLKQLVRACQKQFEQSHERPECLTSQIYQAFPVLSELSTSENHPLKALCDHILERYDLNNDQHVRKVLSRVETESLWNRHMSVAKKNSQITGSNYREQSSSCQTTPTADQQAKYESPSVINNEYKRVEADTTENGMVLKLVRMSLGTRASVDQSSEGAIASILRKACCEHEKLAGAGFLIRRYKKTIGRNKNHVENELMEVPNCVRTPVPMYKTFKPAVSTEVKKTAFLSNVSKFQEKFNGTSNNEQRNGQRSSTKRKAIDVSICRDIQTKYANTRMETTMAALKNHVTKRLNQ